MPPTNNDSNPKFHYTFREVGVISVISVIALMGVLAFAINARYVGSVSFKAFGVELQIGGQPFVD